MSDSTSIPSLPQGSGKKVMNRYEKQIQKEKYIAQDAGEELSRHLYQCGGQEDASLRYVAVACGL